MQISNINLLRKIKLNLRKIIVKRTNLGRKRVNWIRKINEKKVRKNKKRISREIKIIFIKKLNNN